MFANSTFVTSQATIAEEPTNLSLSTFEDGSEFNPVDNQPNAKDMISDVKEKMLEMEDIDKDEYIEKARIMKAKQIE